ncbi:MAG: ribonuclease H-like domain-containing protein [Verrucomicrobiales bacterium]
MPGTVYFDLETQRSFGDVGGAANKDKMGMSVGVTFSTETGKYHIYGEDEVEALIDQLVKADLVVGFNHIYFDYPVLQGYTIYDLANQTVNCDMLIELEKALGHRIKLDSVASATLGVGKTADGLDALRWWQAYKKSGDPDYMMKIAEYCCYDVKVTKEVYEYAARHGHLKYDDRGGNLQEVEITW